MVNRHRCGEPCRIICSHVYVCILVIIQAGTIDGIVTKIFESADFLIIHTKTFTCTDPQSVCFVRHNLVDSVIDKRIFARWVMIKTLHPVAVQTIQAVSGANPDKAFLILCNRSYSVAGQSFFLCKIIELNTGELLRMAMLRTKEQDHI